MSQVRPASRGAPGLCKDSRLAQGYGVSACTVTHGNGRGLRRLQGRACFTSVFTSSPKVVYVCLFVPTLRLRRYWPFTFPPCRIRAPVVAHPSCSRHAPSRVIDGLDEANCSAETSSRRTKRPRWLLFKRCQACSRRVASRGPCTQALLHGRPCAQGCRGLRLCGRLVVQAWRCFHRGHNALAVPLFSFWHT